MEANTCGLLFRDGLFLMGQYMAGVRGRSVFAGCQMKNAEMRPVHIRADSFPQNPSLEQKSCTQALYQTCVQFESRIAVVCSTDWQNSTGLRQAVLMIAEGQLGAGFSKIAVYTGSLPSATVACSTDWENGTGLGQAVLMIVEGRLGTGFSKIAVYTGSLPCSSIGQGGSGDEAKDDDHKG